MGTVKQYLNETSLARVYKHMKGHDTGTITAFRFGKDCGKGDKYTKKENLQRNKSLLAKLQNKRYGVTSIKGSYIENYGTKDAKEVGENVFFVVDIFDKGNLLKDLKKLGEEFDQDSILFIPKGGESSSLHGTNHCSDFPGYNKQMKFSKRIIGDKGGKGDFFSKVKGRPFLFKENDDIGLKEHVLPEGYMGKYGCSGIANTHWSNIEV